MRAWASGWLSGIITTSVTHASICKALSCILSFGTLNHSTEQVRKLQVWKQDPESGWLTTGDPANGPQIEGLHAFDSKASALITLSFFFFF